MNYPKELIKALYAELPDVLADAIVADQTIDTLDELAKAHSFNPAQRATLEDVVTNVLFGLQSPQSFIPELQNALGVDQPTASQIAEAVGKSIFSKIPEKILVTQEAAAQKKLKESMLQQAAPEPTSRQGLIDEIEHPQPAPERALGAPTQLMPQAAPVARTDSPASLAPAEPKPAGAAANMIGEKLAKVVAPPVKSTAYPDGKDPYREPLQ